MRISDAEWSVTGENDIIKAATDHENEHEFQQVWYLKAG